MAWFWFVCFCSNGSKYEHILCHIYFVYMNASMHIYIISLWYWDFFMDNRQLTFLLYTTCCVSASLGPYFRMTCFCIQVRKLPLRPPEKKVLGIPRCWDIFLFCFGMLAVRFFVLFTGYVPMVRIYQMCLLFCSSCWSSNLDGDLQRVVFLLGFFDWFLHHLFLNKQSGYVWGRTRP